MRRKWIIVFDVKLLFDVVLEHALDPLLDGWTDLHEVSGLNSVHLDRFGNVENFTSDFNSDRKC